MDTFHHELEIERLEIEQVSIWLSKHRAARKYRYELQQQTSQLIRLELLLDMLLNLLEREKRLYGSLEIGFAVNSEVGDLIQQANNNENVKMQIKLAKCQRLIECTQQQLSKYPLGDKWVAASKKIRHLDNVISEEKQNIQSAKYELEVIKSQHKINVSKVKKEIQKIVNAHMTLNEE